MMFETQHALAAGADFDKQRKKHASRKSAKIKQAFGHALLYFLRAFAPLREIASASALRTP